MFPAEKIIAQNEQGVQLILIGGGREHQIFLVYKHKDFNFDLTATRYGSDGGQIPSDTHRVNLGIPLKHLKSELAPILTKEKLNSLYENISEGLQLLELDINKSAPLKTIEFHMWPYEDNLVKTFNVIPEINHG